MPIVVQTNMPSLETQKHLNRAPGMLNKSFSRLSSGVRVDPAADDAAGLAISESMKSQIRSYTVAERNANDAIGMTQTAASSLGEMSSIIGRLRELAMQGSNASMTAADRGHLSTEFGALQGEMSRIQQSAKFNDKQLLQATPSSVTFHVRLDNASSDQIDVTFGGLGFSALLSAGVTNVAGATASASLAALGTIDAALTTISTARARYGAAMNRLEVTTSSIQTMRNNLSAANSRIVDVDVAEETANLSKHRVLTQAGTAVLAQANQLSQLAMNLLK